jgi:nucleotide-binding universal stress UspA family protein
VDGIVRTLKDEGVSARGELLEAPPAAVGDVISDLAHVADAKLIVMGSRGFGLVRRLVHGSVARDVMHRPGRSLVSR